MDFKEKIKQRIQEKDVNPASNENEISEIGPDEAFETSQFFGIDNVRNFPACIDLRLSDGNAKALPYSYIVEINFNASEGIEVLTATKKILITGRNLQRLYNYLVAFRVKYIQANIGNDVAEEKILFVKEIVIEES